MTQLLKIFSVLQLLTGFLQRTMKAKVTAVVKAHPPWFHSLSLPSRKAWWQGKNTVSLFGCAESTLSIWQRMWNHRKAEWRMGEIFFLRKWFMGLRLCNSWVNNVLWVSLGVCSARVCVSIGNKSLSVPRMRAGSQVSHSHCSSFSRTQRSWKCCDSVQITGQCGVHTHFST